MPDYAITVRRTCSSPELIVSALNSDEAKNYVLSRLKSGAMEEWEDTGYNICVTPLDEAEQLVHVRFYEIKKHGVLSSFQNLSLRVLQRAYPTKIPKEGYELILEGDFKAASTGEVLKGVSAYIANRTLNKVKVSDIIEIDGVAYFRNANVWEQVQWKDFSANDIRRGLVNGIVKIIDSPMHDGAVCKIGENWFYFGGMTAEAMSAKEYLSAVPVVDIAAEIADALNELVDCGDDRLKDDADYYKSVLVKTGII